MKLGELPRVPNVVGGDELAAKQSAVNEQGKLRLQPVDRVTFRPIRHVPHEDGHVTEIARASWADLAGPVVQVHLTTTFPGRLPSTIVQSSTNSTVVTAVRSRCSKLP